MNFPTMSHMPMLTRRTAGALPPLELMAELPSPMLPQARLSHPLLGLRQRPASPSPGRQPQSLLQGTAAALRALLVCKKLAISILTKLCLIQTAP